MVDEAGAIPGFVDRQRVFIDQNDHTFVVIHKTASGGSAQDIANFFATDPRMASTHYIVGQDGEIVQCVLEVDGAGGNCCLETGHAAFLPLGVNLNVKTVSIEHVDPASDNSTPLTLQQKLASFKLVYDICKRHSIPMRRGDASGGIIGHCDIAPLSRARCPGNYPWDDLFAYLEKGDDMSPPIILSNSTVASYFTQTSPTSWHCTKTNKVLLGGMLSYYQTCGASELHGLLDLGLPVSNEVAIEKIDASYQHLAGSGIVVQFFERGVLVYDVKHVIDNPPGAGSVYRAHLYGLPGQDPLIKELQAQLTQLPTPVADTSAQEALQAELDAANEKLARIKADVA